MTWLNDDLIAEVRTVWGDLLKPLPTERVPAALSTPTREFLTTVGLPTADASEFAAVPDDTTLTSRVVDAREYVPVTDVLGEDYYFAVDVDSDEVFYLHEGATRACLVNSNLGLFVLFVGKYYRDVLNLPVHDEQSLETATGDVLRSLVALDPSASGDECWWSPTLYQVASEYE